MAWNRVYLDHAAMAPLSDAARAAMVPLLDAMYANASSPHLEGRAAKDALEDARSQVAKALGCRPREILFTSGATEAATIALHGAAHTMAAAGRRKIVVSAVEYPAVMDTAAYLGSQGYDIVTVPVSPEGVVDAQTFLDAAGDDTAVAALMLANHETGAVMPVAEIAPVLRERRIPFLCDAALAPGRLPLDTRALGADMALFSGPKIGGPAGSGALFVRRGTRLTPILQGGVQEERLRPGTENVAACAGFAAAFEEACAQCEDRSARYGELARVFLAGLDDLEGCSRVGPRQGATLPGLVTLELKHAEGEAVMINMDLEGFALSTGSTCALGSSDPSPGLLAMGFTKQRAATTIRVSVGEGNDRDHMERAASTLCRIVSRLRSLARR